MSPPNVGSRQQGELALETAASRRIPNAQLLEISRFEQAQFRDIEARYGARADWRTDPTPRYNCHGMTFASRRTGIFETWVINRILDDDGYREVTLDEVLAGDVILYFDDTGDVEHSGIVILPPSQDPLRVPLIYSKWGKYAELVHRANQCPYNFAGARYYRVL